MADSDSTLSLKREYLAFCYQIRTSRLHLGCYITKIMAHSLQCNWLPYLSTGFTVDYNRYLGHGEISHFLYFYSIRSFAFSSASARALYRTPSFTSRCHTRTWVFVYVQYVVINGFWQKSECDRQILFKISNAEFHASPSVATRPVRCAMHR